MEYREFLERKRTHVPHSGFDPGDDVGRALFPFQRDIVRWAVMGGRRAIFAAFGLGKSVMQLEIMRLVQAHDGGRALNTGYFLDAVKYLEAEERRQSMPTLFDMEGIGE